MKGFVECYKYIISCRGRGEVFDIRIVDLPIEGGSVQNGDRLDKGGQQGKKNTLRKEERNSNL